MPRRACTNCEFWASIGECKNNPAYMENACAIQCPSPDKPSCTRLSEFMNSGDIRNTPNYAVNDVGSIVSVTGLVSLAAVTFLVVVEVLPHVRNKSSNNVVRTPDSGPSIPTLAPSEVEGVSYFFVALGFVLTSFIPALEISYFFAGTTFLENLGTEHKLYSSAIFNSNIILHFVWKLILRIQSRCGPSVLAHLCVRKTNTNIRFSLYRPHFLSSLASL